jgi:arylsulfatase A
MVEYMDVVIGRLVDKLEELGLRENTLILFLGDNGSPREITSLVNSHAMQGGKGKSTEAGTHVPLIANWPGTIAPGSVSDDMVDCGDFIPTMMEAAGVPLPEGEIFDGTSFLPQLRGERGNPHEWLYFYHNPLPGWGKKGYRLQRWVQDKRFKLYDDGQFFDYQADVLEERPIAEGTGGPEAEAARRKLQSVLERMLQEEKLSQGTEKEVR